MSKGQKLRRQIMATKSATASAKDGSSDQGDSDGRGDTVVKDRNIIAQTGFYFATSPRQFSPPTLKKKNSSKKLYKKPKQPTAEMDAPAPESQGENDYYCADNTSGGFYYEVDGSKGWIRYPHEMRQENAIQPFDFSIPPPAPYLPGSPVTVAVPESISSLDSLEDSLSSPRMSSSSNVGSCLSLNTTLDSGTVDYGWSYAVCKTGAESPAASMASPIESGQEPDWSSAPNSSSSEEETLAEQIKQVSVLWD